MWKPFILRWVSIGGMSLLLFSVQAQPAPPQITSTNALVMTFLPPAEYSPAGVTRWIPIRTNDLLYVGDRIRVGNRGFVTLLLSDQSVVDLDEKTEVQFVAPKAQSKQSRVLQVFSGLAYFFHRGRPVDLEVQTEMVSGAVRGTEFVVEVANDGTTIFTVIDGVVEISNPLGNQTLFNGDQGVAAPGAPPIRRPALNLVNSIQWTFYYPGVLDESELQWPAGIPTALTSALDAYRSGDLLRAIELFPPDRVPETDAERVFLAALFLGVGQVDDAEALLTAEAAAGVQPRNHRLAQALRRMIKTVKALPLNSPPQLELATEQLAESYYQQAQRNLEAALQLAESSVATSTNFAFGHARVAELQFSFGHVAAASDAIERSLAIAPRNAQAVALKGFLLAAQNRIRAARLRFDEAIALNGQLANGWLGRGLTRIRSGDLHGGREDLLIASAVEPNRAFLRSYLGKAYSEEEDLPHAEKELALAQTMDPLDPTAWLYSALLKQQNNRINEAIHDLEHAQELNDNRSLYRSKFHLDQDLAVRSANLARIYKDAGMFDWSLREAGRALADDYGNYSAHLFLAESYAQMRNPILTNRRFDAAETAEYLIANLLAPVGAGPLSPTISQSEYSKLFERDRFGLLSVTEYLSRGAWAQTAAQFGTFGNFSYTLEGNYITDPGQAPNNDIEVEQLALQLKYQLTPADTFFFRAEQADTETGDFSQRYDLGTISRSTRTEIERPEYILGYRHQWHPQSHTLVLVSYLEGTVRAREVPQSTLLLLRPEGPIFSIHDFSAQGFIERDSELAGLELQQLWSFDDHDFNIGARVQHGENRFNELLRDPTIYEFFFPDNRIAFDKTFTTDFQRYSLYAYHHWRPFQTLLIASGLSYDYMDFPQNLGTQPITEENREEGQLSPKAGFVWSPLKNTTLKGAFARSLGGIGFDQNIRIEPTQVAGINQTFRNVMPESWDVPTAGAEIDIISLSLDHRTQTRTYFGLEVSRLSAKGSRRRGAFEVPPGGDFAFPTSIGEEIDYTENSLRFTVNQLIGDEWSFGLRYEIADADHDRVFLNIPPRPDPNSPFFDPARKPQERIEAVLHTLTAQANFNHRSGAFASAGASFYAQDIDGFPSAIDNDRFWHFNVATGYRFWRRRAELAIGVLNLSGQDYQLLPLNVYGDLPRERTFFARFRWEL